MYKCAINLKDGQDNLHVYAVIIEYEPNPNLKNLNYHIRLLSINGFIPVYIEGCRSSHEAVKIANRICEKFPSNGSLVENKYNDSNTIDRDEFQRMVKGWGAREKERKEAVELIKRNEIRNNIIAELSDTTDTIKNIEKSITK